MEKFGAEVAVVGTILLIGYIRRVMRYVYLKKGNIKKDFGMIVVSLIVTTVGITTEVYRTRNNEMKGVSLPNTSIRIIQNVSSEDATLKQKSEVGSNVYLKINDEDWQKYRKRIKRDYIDWQKSLKDTSDEETLKIQFNSIRKKVLEKTT